MSEFLAEARILVRPDTTGFRAELEAALASATKPITIPVVPVVAGGLATATAQTEAFTAAQAGAAAETQAVAAALEKETIAATQATAAQTAHSRSVAGLARGAGASALSLFGLRGATLAASGAFLAGTAAVVAFGKSLQSAAELETQLNVFRVNAGATADEMARVSEEARQLGRDITLPGVTAGTAAEAMTTLAKAGLSVRDSMAAARGTLQLATAAEIDVATATELVAGSLNAFGLAGEDAVKVADLLAGAAGESQGEIEDLGLGLQQVQGTAQAFGVSLGDTVTALTILTKSGLSARQAGTGLNVALIRLATNKDAQKFVTDLGLKIRDMNQNIRPQVFAELGEAMQGMSKSAQQSALATLFGRDALKSILPLAAAGTQEFNQVSQAVNEAGLAQEKAAARTSGLQGAMENLSNQVGALGLVVGEVAKGPVTQFANDLAGTVSEMTTAAEGAVRLTGAMRDFTESIPGEGPLNQFGLLLKKAAEVSNPLTLTLKLAAEGAKQLGAGAEEAGGKLSVFDGIANTVKGTLGDLADAFNQAAAAARAQQPAQGGLNVKEILNIGEGFDARQTRDKIAKDNQALLSDLNAERDFLIAQLQRDYVKNRPALKRALEQQLLGANTEIDSILKSGQAARDKAKADAERAAKEALAAANARDQALLSAQNVARQQRQNAIDQASQTPGLQDDIKRERQLRALVLAQIAAVKQRITDETTRKAALVALNSILISVGGTIKSLVAQQKANQEQQRQDLLQGVDLDIELANVTGDQAAEVRARNRKIAALNKDLQAEKKAHGTTTILYKQIALEIARQNAAKKDIQGEVNKGRSFAQETFEFLQTQQGFASNLLGNLIPTGATGGLVGGGAPVSAALTPVAGLADGQSKSGPTAGQAQTTNSILLGILNQLKVLNGDMTAPEAQRQNRGQRAVMDGVGGG